VRVASIGEGLIDIWDAELPREQYPLFHALRAQAAWIRARLLEARIPITDPGPPPPP
jgi:hypothetical protein